MFTTSIPVSAIGIKKRNFFDYFTANCKEFVHKYLFIEYVGYVMSSSRHFVNTSPFFLGTTNYSDKVRREAVRALPCVYWRV